MTERAYIAIPMRRMVRKNQIQFARRQLRVESFPVGFYAAQKQVFARPRSQSFVSRAASNLRNCSLIVGCDTRNSLLAVLTLRAPATVQK